MIPRSRGSRSTARGQIIITLAVLMIPLLGMAGLAIDLGRLYVVRAELSKAVDGAALAAARTLPQGHSFARTAANAFARMNFAPSFMGCTSRTFTVSFNTVQGRPRVQVDGQAVLPTTLMRVLGVNSVTVRAQAEATRRPLAGCLVNDTSLSMSNGNAIAFLKTAAKNFINEFDDSFDKWAHVRFASGRRVLFALANNFKSTIRSQINGYQADGWTAAHDAIAAGAAEVQKDTAPETFHALVFFTDGRPTAFRETFRIGSQDVDGNIAGGPHPWDGYASKLLNPTQIDQTLSYNTPSTLPDGRTVTATVILEEAKLRVRQAAASARNNGITIFTVGLGDPNEDPWEIPDVALLVEVANVQSAPDPLHPGQTIVNANYDPSQPEGAFYYAPSPSQLNDLFERLAGEISLRLTR